jgi:hypothetical protein
MCISSVAPNLAFYISNTFALIVGCPSGFYGMNCVDRCSINCGVPERCDRISGQCDGDCQSGWRGILCDTSKVLLKEFFENPFSL